jgi:hypothetical protein
VGREYALAFAADAAGFIRPIIVFPLAQMRAGKPPFQD